MNDSEVSSFESLVFKSNLHFVYIWKWSTFVRVSYIRELCPCAIIYKLRVEYYPVNILNSSSHSSALQLAAARAEVLTSLLVQCDATPKGAAYECHKTDSEYCKEGKRTSVNFKVVEDVTWAESSVACLCYVSDTAGGWDIDCPRGRGTNTLPGLTIYGSSTNTRLCAQHESIDGFMELSKFTPHAHWSCVVRGGQ